MAARGKLKDGASASGYYQVPVLFRDVPPNSRLAQEEVFGPVLAAMAFDTEEEAVALANGTLYGLVAGVWTRDGARQLRLARQLRAGQVFVNNYGAGGGVELPFGGSRQSGYGREGVRGAVWLHDLEDDCDQALTRWRGFVARPRPRRVRGLGFVAAPRRTPARKPASSVRR